MRCRICNSILSPPEINWNTDHKDWDPCSKCLDVINDVFNDKTEKEIDDELILELEDFELTEEMEVPDE